MLLSNYLLSGILLMLSLGAVIAFSYCVIKPLQTRWAIKHARKIVAAGYFPAGWRTRNVYRMLATSHDDLEAAKLWRQMDGMRELSDSLTDREFRKIVGMIPPHEQL
jgi:hypothetical protein